MIEQVLGWLIKPHKSPHRNSNRMTQTEDTSRRLCTNQETLPGLIRTSREEKCWRDTESQKGWTRLRKPLMEEQPREKHCEKMERVDQTNGEENVTAIDDKIWPPNLCCAPKPINKRADANKPLSNLSQILNHHHDKMPFWVEKIETTPLQHEDLQRQLLIEPERRTWRETKPKTHAPPKL